MRLQHRELRKAPAGGDRILDYSSGNFEAPVGGDRILAQGVSPGKRLRQPMPSPARGDRILDCSSGNFEAPVGGDRILAQGVSPGKRLRNRSQPRKGRQNPRLQPGNFEAP